MSRFALIDLGTNTIRLVIGEPGKSQVPRFLYHEVVGTRLGEGLAGTGTLKQAAIERTVEGLKRFKDIALKYEARVVEAYATAWARAASNTDEALMAFAEINLPVWILTASEEASMAVLAVRLMGVSLEKGWIIDIGGGSTQVIQVENKALKITPIPWGAVNFTEKFLSGDLPGSSLEAAEEEAKKAFPLDGLALSLFALGGTSATLGALKVKLLPSHPDFFKKAQGLFLETDWICSMIKKLAGLSLAERKKLLGMEPSRADIILGGLLLLQAFLQKLKAKGATLCLYSFVHGLLAERLKAF